MAGSKSNPPRARKRVEVDSNTLKRARDGSAFTRCEECGKDVPVGLIDMHSCSLDSKIKMTLEAQVIDNVATARKSSEKKRVATSAGEESTKKEKKVKNTSKKVKDPSKPKRPLTAFFLFMDDFRKTFKLENPDSKGVSKAAKEGGEKWKSMTDEEKKPYVDKAAALKAEYAISVEKRNNGEEDCAVSMKQEDDGSAENETCPVQDDSE